MPNKGVAPFDPTSSIGKFRVAVGDTAYVDLDPPEAGFGDYADYSDAEIEAFLALNSDQVEGAIADVLFQMALSAAKEAKNVKDFDLQVDLTKRASELRLLAGQYRDRANAASADIFETFDIVDQGGCCTPELAAHQFRRCC